MRNICRAAFAAIVAFGASTSAYSQDAANIGQREFVNNCAVCHGAEGRGDGPLAGLLNQKVPDLTVLQRENQGVFPFERVYDMVDGNQWVPAHGAREMPVWGKEYSKDAADWLGYDYAPADVENFVRGRILALIGYMLTLQQE